MNWVNVAILPEIDQIVLVFLPAEVEFPIWLGYWDGACWRSDAGAFILPTHWMDLPKPPTARPANASAAA
jgi:hypothetical protein